MPIKRRRLLVVDDLRDAAESLAFILSLQGYEAQWLTDPFKVIEVARGFRPDLIFLDLGMPKLDGYTLAKMLREEFGFDTLRLVALTAWGRDVDRVASRQAGFDAHVTKPADPDMIESVLATIFDGAS